MPHESLSEEALIHYAREQELKGKPKSALFERFKELTLELGRIPLAHSRLKEVEAALEAEIQPYIDRMDALEGKAQDDFIRSVPEHVRHSIDLLNATQEALTHLQELDVDLMAMQQVADQLYDESLRQEEIDKANRSLPN